MHAKILIVEDDKNINMMIRIILKNKKLNWEFRAARDGVEAMEVLSTYKADLALIDLAMPKMDGAELIQKIRHDPELAQCKIAVLTSSSDEALRNKLVSSGVREYWKKPITAEMLFSNIAAMLG